MIPITKEEAEQLRAKFPNLCITTTVHKRNRYATETKSALAFLAKIRDSPNSTRK